MRTLRAHLPLYCAVSLILSLWVWLWLRTMGVIQ